MAIVSWNVRGLNSEQAMRQTKLLIKIHKPDMLFLMETKLAEGKVNMICNKLGYDHGFEIPRVGLGGGIMVLWKNEMEVIYLTSSSNHFSCFLRLANEQRYWHFSGFYGDPKVMNRRHTWDLLQKLRSVSSGPWLVMGDFNEILGQEDKEGGGMRSDSQIEAFRNSVESCALHPLEYKGDHYTWIKNTCAGYVKERLDWAMSNEDWLQWFPDNSLVHLDFFHSDHRALYLCLHKSQRQITHNSRRRARFRFENMWIREAECRDIIKANWGQPNQDALLSTIKNIEYCSANLTSWNKSKFGSMAKEIKETHKTVMQLHNIQDQLGDNSELKDTEKKLNELLQKEEIFWRQRSRIQWLQAGDQNTKFFHQRAKKRHKANAIEGLMNEENVWCSDEKEIGNIIQSFYEKLFTSVAPAGEEIEELLKAVQTSVTEETNKQLEEAFTIEEIKKAMFSISTDKSPGPDGMNAMFYQKHWDIVGPLVSKAILDCLDGNADLGLINSTLVTLVPKIQEPKSTGDFRPISLCNVLYKVISKVLINRLKHVLPSIINGTQSAFVPGRLITDKALIAYECLHHLRHMKEGKRCYAALKLDMSKAYDRVEWIFIEKMLIKIGFSQRWVNKLMKCVTSVRYAFQINGQTYGEIVPSRGLRQGDPLSPYLFLICAEGFSALIRQAENERAIQGLKIARNAPSISHLFFADDSLLFVKAQTKSLQSIQDIFSLYSKCSGQVINFNKSLLFFSPNTTEAIRMEFTNSLKMQTTEEIESYLGLPMIGGKNKKVMFRQIKDKIWARLHSWSLNLFSRAGKEILLRTVIQSMPTYLMSCYKIPEGQCKEIEKLMARYWWGSIQTKRQIHWRAWKKICIPKREGGLGFRCFVQFNQALLAKQAWRILIFPTSLISQVLQARYFTNSNFLDAKEGNVPSMTWRSICWGKELLIRGLRKRIGNGQNTQAYKDPWIPRPPSFLPISRGLNENITVSELINQPGKWNKELIQQSFLPPDSEYILTIPLSPFYHTDSWFWHYTSNGKYSVKSGYNLATKVEEASASSSSNELTKWWSIYWLIKVPQKILNFGWRGYHEILPTMKGLHRRNVINHSNCTICGYSEESNAHSVFWCPFAQQVWTLMEYSFLMEPKEEISFKGVLLYATEILGQEELAKMLVTAWGIWTERNKINHGQQQRPPNQIKAWVTTYYEEVKKAEQTEGGTHSELFRGGQTIEEVKEFSLFVDAAVSTNRQKIGLGAAILTANKKVQATLSKPLNGTISVLHAEALALLVGLNWGKSTGLPINSIFTDSQTLVHALNNAHEYYNEFGFLLSDIKMLLSDVAEATISHINRKYNVRAHSLAKQAIQLEEELSRFEEIQNQGEDQMR